MGECVHEFGKTSCFENGSPGSRTYAGEALKDNYFHYVKEDLVIAHGSSYDRDVRATVGRKALHAWATTTVPREGFRIAGVNHEKLSYRPLNEEGEPVNFVLTIERNPDSRLYMRTVRPAPGVDDLSRSLQALKLKADRLDLERA